MEINKDEFQRSLIDALNKRPKVSGGQVYIGKDLNRVLVSAEDEAKAMAEKAAAYTENNGVDAAKKALYTGHIGDGKIFVYNVAKVVKVRTGEQDYAALQDVE
jgi:nitrogen regulatory protein PII